MRHVKGKNFAANTLKVGRPFVLGELEFVGKQFDGFNRGVLKRNLSRSRNLSTVRYKCVDVTSQDSIVAPFRSLMTGKTAAHNSKLPSSKNRTAIRANEYRQGNPADFVFGVATLCRAEPMF